MKHLWQNSANRYTKPFATITKLSLGLFVLCFIAYSEFFAQTDDEQGLKQERKPERRSSISMSNGICRVDTAIIWSDRNRYALLDELERENLADKTTKAEIPGFIMAFLGSISPNRKFDIANPGEKWWPGDIKDMEFKSVYDTEKCDTLCVPSGNRGGLPDKQLVYCGIGKKLALLSWHVAGARLSQCTVIIEFKNKTIVDFWFQNSQSLSATKYEILKSIAFNGNC